MNNDEINGIDEDLTAIYKQVLDDAGVVVSVCDINTYELIYVNKAAMRFAGEESGTYIGRPCYEYLKHCDYPCNNCIFKMILKYGSKSVVEHLGDKYYHIEGKVSIWNDRQVFISFIYDITKEINANTQLTLERKNYKNIIDSINVGVMVFNRRDDIITCLAVNEAVKRITGINFDGISHLNVMDMRRNYNISKEHAIAMKLVHDTFYSEEQEAEEKYCIYNKKYDSHVWVLAHGKSYLTDDGSYLAYITYTDISEIKRLEEKLISSEASLKIAISHIGARCGKYYLNENYIIMQDYYANKESESEMIYNYPEGYLTNGHVYKDDIGIYKDAIDRLHNGENQIDFFARIKNKKTGTYQWRRIMMTMIDRSERRPYALLTSEDMDDYKRMIKRYSQIIIQNDIECWEYDVKSNNLFVYGVDTNGNNSDGIRQFVIPDVPNRLFSDNMIYPDDIDICKSMFDNIHRGVSNGCIQIRMKSGIQDAFKWYEVKYTTMDSKDGHNAIVFGSNRDLTEEKRLERLYKEEQLYRSELSGKIMAQFVVNLSKTEGEGLTIAGEKYSRDDLSLEIDYRDRLKKHFSNIAMPSGEKYMPSLMELLNYFYDVGDEFKTGFLGILNRTGKYVYVEFNVHMLTRPDTGNVIGFFYLTDKTEEYLIEKNAKVLLLNNYDYVGSIFVETGLSKLITIDKHIKQANSINMERSYEDAIKESFIPRVVTDNIEEAVKAMRLDTIIEMLSKEDIYYVEFDMKTTSGEIRKKRWGFTYCDRTRMIITICCTDIEDIVKTQRQRQKELADALEEAQRANESKTMFLSNASHDMRTPLNGLIGYARLASETDDIDKKNYYLSKIQSSGKVLLNLINDTLDMSKIENYKFAFNPELIDARDIIESVEAAVGQIANDKGVKLTIRYINPYTGSIYADRLRMQQVLLNLLSNAVKFTNPGGEVELTIEYLGKRDLGPNCKVVVKDNGIGIEESFIPYVFEPFAQGTNSNTETVGTGLGLTIVKNLVELMGGYIELKSQKNVGTTFTIYLRLTGSLDHVDKEVDLENIDEVLIGKSILLCEDNPINIELAQIILEKKGMKVRCAANGEEAVEIFKASDEGSFDAILMDIRMPIMNGMEATKAIRAMGKKDSMSIPIIAMTANAFDDDRENSRAAGMNKHLSKPIDPDILYRSLAKLIAKND